jgi:16S rRNA (guanine(1405)-N(7))-methyltransferase
MRAVEACAAWRGDGKLAAQGWTLRDGWAPINETFDVALMLKIVPVVKRQEPALLEILARVPARRVIVTGSKEALVKRRAIARREKNVIETFAREAGFRILHVFETPDEIGIVAETR